MATWSCRPRPWRWRRGLVELTGEVRLLRLGLPDLLVAEALLVGLLRRLLRELGDHLLGQAADLAEGVRLGAGHDLHELVAVRFLRNLSENADDLRPRVIPYVHRLLAGSHAHGRLQQHLHPVRQDLLGLLDRSRLLTGLLLASGPLRRFRRAALLQLREVLGVRREGLLGLLERRLGRMLLLLCRGPRLRSFAELLLRD